MIYIDTNIFVYAIQKHLEYGKACSKILDDINNEKLEATSSVLVLSEFISVLVRLRKIDQGISIKESLEAVLSLPITWFDMDIFTLEKASTYNFNISGMDYIHLATMEINSIVKIISADADFDKVEIVKRIDPLKY